MLMATERCIGLNRRQPVENPDTPPGGPPDPRPLLEAAPRYGLEFRLPNDR